MVNFHGKETKRLAAYRFAHGCTLRCRQLGGRISQGACAPETGHLADSMPEVEVEEYSLKLSIFD